MTPIGLTKLSPGPVRLTMRLVYIVFSYNRRDVGHSSETYATSRETFKSVIDN